MITEPEILTARQSFPDAQAALDGVGSPFGNAAFTVGWYGTRVSAERGSFCIVNADGPLAELVGDTVRLRYGPGSTVLAYCVGSADLEWDMGVTRRVFAAVELLSVDIISVTLEVIS